MTVANLDAVIGRTYAPTDAAKLSNARNRPIGIGVQGLADVFMQMRMPFESPQARQLNFDIFECIYRSALSASCDLARVHGPYPTYEGSPASRGMLQPDLFLAGHYGSDESRELLRERVHTGAWQEIRAKIAEHGLRHSVVTALMPTASTAQILGNVEAFEALGSNIFVRRTLAGEFTLVNERLVRDLRAMGRWNDDVRYGLIRAEGSVQDLDISADFKATYRTVWEIPQRAVCQLAADRQPFVDQAQSLNIHMEAPTVQKLSSLHFFNLRDGTENVELLRSEPRCSICYQVHGPARGA